MSRHARPTLSAALVTATLLAAACSSSDDAGSATVAPVTTVPPAATTASPPSTTSTVAAVVASTTTEPIAATTTPASTGSPTAFTVTYTEDAPPGPVACAEADQACVTNGLAPARPTTGDWTGSVVSATGNATAGDLTIGNGLIAFSGTVAPCGAGTVVLTVLTVRGPIDAPAPGSTIEFDETPVEVVAGSGTGELAGMTGSGAASAVVTDTFGVEVTYTLDVDCGGG